MWYEVKKLHYFQIRQEESLQHFEIVAVLELNKVSFSLWDKKTFEWTIEH